MQCKSKYVSSSFQEIMKFDYIGWQSAKACLFSPASIAESSLHEGGEIRFLWNSQYLFVMGNMEDSDIVQECDGDNQHLYKSGDVMEVFVKPSGQPLYWELYVASNQRESSVFFPSHGRILPGRFTDFAMGGLVCKAKLDGVLNNYKGKSKGWKAIMTIPMPEFEKSCGPLDLVQVARYNHSYCLDDCELSQIGGAKKPNANFHYFQSYVELEFVK